MDTVEIVFCVLSITLLGVMCYIHFSVPKDERCKNGGLGRRWEPKTQEHRDFLKRFQAWSEKNGDLSKVQKKAGEKDGDASSPQK